MKAYSPDKENWRLQPDDATRYEAEAELRVGSDFVSSSRVEMLLEDLEGNVDEEYEDPDPTFTDVSDEAKAELLALLKAWADKHVDMGGMFTLVGEISVQSLHQQGVSK